MRNIRPALLLSLVALAGCGGDDGDGNGNGETAAGDGASSPRDVLRGAQDAIRGVESYHVEGRQTDAEGETILTADVAADGRARMELRQDGATAEAIIVGPAFYLKGDEAFWEQSEAPPRVVELVAGRWVEVPAEGDLRLLSDQVKPETIATCLAERLGTLRSRGTTDFEGQEVEVLVDEGDKPGSAPGELYVAADDPTLPLRLRQTGPRKDGGPAPNPLCGESEDDDTPTTRADTRLSKFGEPVEIEPPAGALDLEEIAAQERDPVT